MTQEGKIKALINSYATVYDRKNNLGGSIERAYIEDACFEDFESDLNKLINSELNRKVEGVVKKYEKVLQNFSTGRHYLDHDDATYRDGMLEAYENVLEDLKSLLNNTKESK